MAKSNKSEVLRKSEQGIQFSGKVVSDDQDGISIHVGNSIFEIKKDDLLSKKESDGVTRIAVKKDANVIQSRAVVASSVNRIGSGVFGHFGDVFGTDCTECSECADCTECSECADCTECSECVAFAERFGHDLAGNPRTFRAAVLKQRLGR